MALKNIGIVSDLHCGSFAGLTPPSYWTERTPAMTRWLWDCWTWQHSNWPKLDLLILNGDLIDGTQRRSEATGLLSASLGVQTDIALECLEPLAKKARKIVRTEGTSYHEGFHEHMRRVDERLGIKTPGTQERIVRDIDLGEGVILNVKHQPEGEGALYRGTTMDRELLWATVMEAQKNLPHASYIIRSHLHSHSYLGGFGKEIHFTGAWCLQAPYALMKKRYRWIPDIGSLLMQRDPLGFRGWCVKPTLFELPQLEATKYEEL